MDDSDGDPYFKISELSDDASAHFSTQYVYSVIEISSQYGHDRSISYSAFNVVGVPSIFPKSGDSPQAFLMRTYGPWWKQLPSSHFVKFCTLPPLDFPLITDDFIEVKFENRVFPTRLDIYETYNPGAIIKVFGYLHDTSSWQVLWQGQPSYPPSLVSRIFSIDFDSVPLKTNVIRLEFSHQHLQYFYQLDAIILHGSDVVVPSNKQNHGNSSVRLRNDFFRPEEIDMKKCNVDNGEQCGFTKLPTEIIHLIMSYLDLRSLCAAAQVSKWFKKICYDPVLFKVLNLQPYWFKVENKTLSNIQARCCSLQGLNLSWCGSRHKIHPNNIMLFVESTCHNLTCLKLSNCSFVNNLVLKTIAKSCQYLQVLELRSCHNQDLTNFGFSQISMITTLVYLDLYRTAIEKFSLLLIIKSCSKLEHLFLGNCSNILEFNEIVTEIGKCLKNLKTLDLWRARSLTEIGVSVLAEQCPNLVELDLGWCLYMNTNRGCIRELVKNCPKLKKLFLTSIRTISNEDLNAIATNLKDIEQLDLLGTAVITVAAIHSLLGSCKKLKLLDISFCGNISESAYTMLRLNFPEVQIKRLYKCDDY